MFRGIAEENVSTATDDFSDLFDMSSAAQSVVNDGDDDETVQYIRKRIRTNKVVLETNGLRVEKGYIYKLERKVISDLRLQFIGSCKPNTAPSMPLLALEFTDAAYDEPTRNRDKSDVEQSPRKLLYNKYSDVVAPKPAISLGRYLKPTTTELFWNTSLQDFVRGSRLLRKSVIVSETNCIVNVYGLGVTGRLFAESATHGSKLVIIEAYSIWNSTKYFLQLTLPMLKQLFKARPEFLKPGKKRDLIQALTAMLYFEYTIDIPGWTKYYEDLVKTRSGGTNVNATDDAAGITTSGVATTNKRNGKPLSARSDSTTDKEDTVHNEVDPATKIDDRSQHSDSDNDCTSRTSSEVSVSASVPETQTVTHLSTPVMPSGYPQTVEEMVRTPPRKPDDPAAPIPFVRQELRISAEVRSNGPVLRKQQTEQRRLALEQQDAENYRALMAKPKRKRYMVGTICRKAGNSGKLLVFLAYNRPLNPNSVSVRAHASIECARLGINIGLGNIKHALDIHKSIAEWPISFIENGVTQALRLLTITPDVAESTCAFQFNGLSGADVNLQEFRTLPQLHAAVTTKRRRRRTTAMVYDAMNVLDPFDDSSFEMTSNRSTVQCRQHLQQQRQKHGSSSGSDVHRIDATTSKTNTAAANYAAAADDDDTSVKNTPKVQPHLTLNNEQSQLQAATTSTDLVLPPPPPSPSAHDTTAVDETDSAKVVRKCLDEIVQKVAQPLDIPTATSTSLPLHASAPTTTLDVADNSQQQTIATTAASDISVAISSTKVGSETTPSEENTANTTDIDNIFSVSITDTTTPHCFALGRHGSTRRNYGELRNCCKPIRFIGSNLRLTSQSTRIGGVHCVYDLFLDHQLYPGAIPSWNELLAEIAEMHKQAAIKVQQMEDEARRLEEELDDDDDSDDASSSHDNSSNTSNEEQEHENTPVNDEVDLKVKFYQTFAPDLRVRLELYLPTATVYLQQQIPTCSRYQLMLGKDELYRLVSDKNLLAHALNATYADFYETATAADVRAAERAWQSIGHALTRQLQWTLRHEFTKTAAELEQERLEREEAERRKQHINTHHIVIDDNDDIFEAAAMANSSTDDNTLVGASASVDESEFTVDLLTGLSLPQKLHACKDLLQQYCTRKPYFHTSNTTATSNTSQNNIKAVQAVEPGCVAYTKHADVSNVLLHTHRHADDYFGSHSSSTDEFQPITVSLTSTQHDNNAATSAFETVQSVDGIEDDSSERKRVVYPTPFFSKVMFSKAIKISSLVDETEKLVLAVVWQWSDEFGVLCYDVCNNLGTTDAGEIFYAQPTAKMQREQSSMWMWLSDYERVLTVQLFLTMELVYLEKIDKHGQIRRLVEFRDENTAVKEELLDNVVETDYSGFTGDALLKVEAAANKRMQKKP